MNQKWLAVAGAFCLSYEECELTEENRRTTANFHPELEISQVLEGRGVYQIGNRRYDFAPGDVFVISHTEPHYISHISGSPLVNRVIMFDPSLIPESPDGQGTYLAAYFRRPPEFENRIAVNGSDGAEISRIMAAIGCELEARRACYPEMVRAQMMSLLVLINRCAGIAPGPEFRGQPDSRIEAALAHMEMHLSETVMLSDLARAARMRQTAFSVRFRAVMGVSPIEYLLKKRIALAVHCLRHSGDTIADIAGICGFQSVANFNRIFKKTLGRVPSDYRP